jgi:ketosteroid isomerase-like protein
MLRIAPRHLVILFAASMAGSTLHAQAANQGNVPREHKRVEREEIEDLERQWQKAQLSGDVAMMDKLLSDDYLGVNANGELSTKKQQLDHMRNRSLVITRLDSSDVKIKIIGGRIAIVNSEVDVDGTLDSTSMHGRYRYTRVYQRVAGGAWKVTSFEATRIRRPGAPAQNESHT